MNLLHSANMNKLIKQGRELFEQRFQEALDKAEKSGSDMITDPETNEKTWAGSPNDLLFAELVKIQDQLTLLNNLQILTAKDKTETKE